MVVRGPSRRVWPHHRHHQRQRRSHNNFYDPADRRIALQDPRTNRTSFAYDKAGQDTRTQNPLGFIATSAYDPAGQQDPRNAEAVAALTTLQDSAEWQLD